MGRRRTIGESRSAGAGRVCTHPQTKREYQVATGAKRFRVRCRRCGQELLPLDDKPPAR
jgi:hypothetical protein